MLESFDSEKYCVLCNAESNYKTICETCLKLRLYKKRAMKIYEKNAAVYIDPVLIKKIETYKDLCIKDHKINIFTLFFDSYFEKNHKIYIATILKLLNLNFTTTYVSKTTIEERYVFVIKRESISSHLICAINLYHSIILYNTKKSFYIPIYYNYICNLDKLENIKNKFDIIVRENFNNSNIGKIRIKLANNQIYIRIKCENAILLDDEQKNEFFEILCKLIHI